MNTASETRPDSEAERLRLAGELAGDSGPDWAAGFRAGTPGCHELLDRASMLSDMLERHLLTHPACVAEPEWYALADRAATALRELYQRVGAEHLAADEDTSEQPRAGGNPTAAGANQGTAPHVKSDDPHPLRENAIVQDKDLEEVANWLHGAARAAGHADLVRGLLYQAAQQAAEMYSAPGDHQTMEEDDDAFGVRNALARFAAYWDECERRAREDAAND